MMKPDSFWLEAGRRAAEVLLVKYNTALQLNAEEARKGEFLNCYIR